MFEDADGASEKTRNFFGGESRTTGRCDRWPTKTVARFLRGPDVLVQDFYLSRIFSTARLVELYAKHFEFRALFYVPLEKSSSVVRFGGKEEVGAICCMLMLR